VPGLQKQWFQREAIHFNNSFSRVEFSRWIKQGKKMFYTYFYVNKTSVKSASTEILGFYVGYPDWPFVPGFQL
jgi:hypothetical protein